MMSNALPTRGRRDSFHASFPPVWVLATHDLEIEAHESTRSPAGWEA